MVIVARKEKHPSWCQVSIFLVDINVSMSSVYWEGRSEISTSLDIGLGPLHNSDTNLLKLISPSSLLGSSTGVFFVSQLTLWHHSADIGMASHCRPIAHNIAEQ